jgi:hypothetical protein
VSNICAVIVWVIKNANRYIDAQLISTYELMVAKCNVHLYKSNQRTWSDEQWRYLRDDEDKPSRFVLDYRIVMTRVGGISQSTFLHNKGLEERAVEFMRDLLTVANNLGFRCETQQYRLNRNDVWVSGECVSFGCQNGDGPHEIIFDVRAFKNGNLHLRLNKKFMLALNVEYGRLKGWLRSASEAVDELGEPEAADFFRDNLQISYANPALLLTAA